MTRFRPFLFAFLAVCFVSATASPVAASDQPNILFIFTDDLGYGDIGIFHQNERAAKKDPAIPYFRTPNIDRLGHEGAKLLQHYVGAPVCAPSRSSLLTGRTQGHTSVRNNQFDRALEDTHTLASVLREAGYATALFGKWGLQGGGEGEAAGTKPAEWPAYPTKRGFDFFHGYVRHRDGHRHYPKEDGKELWENDREISQNLDLCFTPDLFTARAKKWIADQVEENPDRPFFAFLSHDTPHAILQNPPCAYPEGGGLSGGVQWTGKPGAMITTAKGEHDGWMHPDYAGATWDHDGDTATPEQPWPDVQRRYANLVRRIDDCTGDLLQLLDDLGIAGNTLVVFTSDNGPSKESYIKENYAPTFFQGYGPFDGIKRDTLEGGVRVPGLVRWPAAIPAGREVAQAAGQWNWLATFAEMAGIAPPASSDGVSLLPSLTGQGEQRPGILYTEYFQKQKTPGYPDFAKKNRGHPRGEMQVIHLDGYKGLRRGIQSADDDFEIYDLEMAPMEKTDLGGKESFAELQTAMKRRVLQVRRPSSSNPRPYDEAPVPASHPGPGDDAAEGLRCSLYRGEWPWVPDFAALEAESEALVAGIVLPVAGESASGGPLGAAWEGYLRLPEEGGYTFAVESSGGATLFLHDSRIVAEPKNRVAGAGVETGKVRAEAGWHAFRLYARQGEAETLEARLEVRDGEGELVDLEFKTAR